MPGLDPAPSSRFRNDGQTRRVNRPGPGSRAEAVSRVAPWSSCTTPPSFTRIALRQIAALLRARRLSGTSLAESRRQII